MTTTTELPWTLAADSLPEEGVVVDIISTSGMRAQLKVLRRGWFVPDGSMYVYYAVEYWRYQDDDLAELRADAAQHLAEVIAAAANPRVLTLSDEALAELRAL